MGDLMRGISAGIASFVFAWLVPASVMVGLAALLLGSHLAEVDPFKPLFRIAAEGELAAVAVFIGITLMLAVLLAYSSLPLYRLLEGYYFPPRLSHWMSNRHRLRRRRLVALQELSDSTGIHPSALSLEALLLYPDDERLIMPTALGNSLKSLERFGISRYGCDSQLLWYELQAVAPESIRRDTSEGRAPVDFFVSALACLGILTLVSAAVAIGWRDAGAAVLALVSVGLIPFAYRGALRNIKDWANSVKALVNLCRLDVAERLQLQAPWWREGERHMWEQYIGAIEYNDQRFADSYDEYRRPFPSASARPAAPEPSLGDE